MNAVARSPALWFALFLALYLCGRIAGPDDIHTKDQPRTVSYTVDMLQNGNWRCPSDMLGRPATKPPLYNWIAAGPIAATGIYNSLTFKLPSLLAGLGCLLFMALFIRHLDRSGPRGEVPFSPVFWLAALAWLANFTVYGLIYTARPDMLLAFFLAGGWTIGTLLIDDSPLVARRAALWRLALWLCLLAAVLTKGTPAILLVLYLPLYALVRHRSPRPVLRTGPLCGLPAVALATWLWFHSAWSELPAAHQDYLLKTESARVTGSGVLESLREIYQMPQYFLVRFVPWSLLFLWLFLAVDRGRVRASRWTPVYTWFLLILAFFSVPAFKRDDYLLPVYPACALAAGYAAWKVPRRLRIGAVALAVALMAGAVAQDFLAKDDLVPRYADNCSRFARTVRQTLPPGANLVCLQIGYNSLQACLERNSPPAPPSALRPGDYALQAAYLLTHAQARDHRFRGPGLPDYQPVPAPQGVDWELLHLSAPIAQVAGARPGLIGLYRVRQVPAPPSPGTAGRR